MLDPEMDWVMSTHLLMGTPTLVGAEFIDIIYQFSKEFHPDRIAQLSDVIFISPLTMASGTKKRVHLTFTPLEEGYSFSFKSQLEDKDEYTDPWHEHLKGHIFLTPVNEQPRLSISFIKTRLTLSLQSVSNYIKVNNENSFLELGERWDCLKSVYLGDKEWLSELALREDFIDDLTQFPIHPALTDVALFASLAVENFTGETNYLPYGYKKIRMYKPLSPSIVSHAFLREDGTDNEAITFDVTILDPDGGVLMEVIGYTLKKVRSGGPPSKGKDHAIKKKAVAADSKDILPAEGIEAFRRIAACPLFDQIVICTADLQRMIEESFPQNMPQAGSAVDQGSEAVLYERPELSTDYVEPENEIQRTILGIWRGVFGIRTVGLDDDFTELGGNSLLAVQMLANSSDAFNIYIPIGEFYKNPTIRGIAQIVMEQLLGMMAESELEELITNLEN
jgi:hypothetical protein